MLRLSVITTVFLKELRELSRDRRSLMVMLGVPLVIYPLLFAGIGSLAKSKVQQEKVRTVNLAVVGSENAPELTRRLNLEENYLKLHPAPASDSEGNAQLQKGTIDAILTIPLNTEQNLLTTPQPHPTTAPSPPSSQLTTNNSQPTTSSLSLRLDRSRGESDSTEARLRGILTAYERWILEQRLASRGQSPDLLTPIPRSTTDIATKDQRLGKFLAQLLPLLLLVTGMLGAFFPALNATTTERELGTLETLLVSPVKREELLIAKGLLVLGCSILTALLNLLSMSVVFANIAASSKEAFGQVAINPAALALAFASTIPALVLFSAMVMCVGLIARTYREANSFAAPVMMLPMAAMAVGLADPTTTNALLATPVANTTVLIRDILTARFTWPNFALAAGANLAYAAAVLSIAARLFTNEQLVNPAWEPLSLKGFKRRGGPAAPRRLPTVDEAILLMAVAMLTQFYAGPWFGKLFTAGHIDALSLVALLLTASFLLPAVLLALLARYDFTSVFSLRTPKPAYLLAALLFGIGLMPLVMSFGQLQSYLLPAEPSDALKSLAGLIGASFSINPWLAAAIFGIVPGICEEVVFRGVVLSSLRKRTNVHTAVWITALAFAAMHLDLAGLLPRTVLGALLGYITVRSGSLLPAILLHATFNSSQLGLIAFYDPTALSTATTQATTQLSATAQSIPEALRPLSPQSLTRLALALVSITAATILLRTTKPRSPAAS